MSIRDCSIVRLLYLDLLAGWLGHRIFDAQQHYDMCCICCVTAVPSMVTPFKCSIGDFDCRLDSRMCLRVEVWNFPGEWDFPLGNLLGFHFFKQSSPDPCITGVWSSLGSESLMLHTYLHGDSIFIKPKWPLKYHYLVNANTCGYCFFLMVF